MTVAKLRNAHEASFARQMGRPAVCLVALAALATALLLAVAAVLVPPSALADDSGTVLGHSEDGAAEYRTLADAWAAAVSGTTVVMDDDWCTADALTVGEGQSATIKMNGHKIYRDLSESVSKGSVLWVAPRASLTLDGSGSQATFTVRERIAGDERQITSGGLVTGGYSTNSGGGIEMKGNSTVTLINVAVSGNATSHGGGVSMTEKTGTLVMTDAAIDYNETYNGGNAWSLGGGVYIDTPYNTIKMTRSSISHNRADLGGGIYCSTDDASVYMWEGSKIDSNVARSSNSLESGHGGGIYINRSSFTIEGDGTALVSNNYADKVGGGVYIDSVSSGTETGIIRGIKFKWDKSPEAGGIWCKQQNITFENCLFFRCESDSNAGALYIDEENTTVRGCTFTKCSAGDYGGAIYNYEEGTLIDACTMTGNICGIEGGAVWTDWDYDIALAGTVVIKDNKRLDGAADDIFLDTRAGGGSKAYLTGTLEKGSKVGVRTGYEQDRLIAEEFSDIGGFSLFIDMAGYYVTYGSDHSGDAWQRKGETTFLVIADGTEGASYRQGDPVTVNALKGNASKAFWRWSEDSTIGLTPFADYVPDPTVRTLSFAMPQNNVILVSEYVARTASVSLAVDAPRAGEELPSTGTLSWIDADEKAQEKEVAVSWLEVGGEGATPAEGKAKPGTTYALSACIAMDGPAGLAFALDMGVDDVPVSFRASDGTLSGVGAASVAVDADTEALSLVSNTYALPKAKLASVEAAQATVAEGTAEAELREQLAIAALGADEYGNEVSLTADAATADLSALLSEGYAAVPEGGKATVSLPVCTDAADNPDGLMLEVTVTVEPTYLQVTFDAAGGTPVPEAQSVRWGTAASAPEEPASAASMFLGWFAEGSDVAWDFTTPVTSALKLTARWTGDALSVTFDAAGGAPTPRAQSVKHGACAQEPASPRLEGETFLGWFAEGADEAWDFSTPVTQALALTARWEAVTHAVDFVFANGQGAERVTVAHGSVVSTPAAPTREGYAFLGWYTDSGVRYNFSTPVRDSLTLTAWWAPAPAAFSDVPADSWYATWVAQAASRGLMSGYTDGIGAYTGLFGPEDALTRGQVATVLWRMAGCPDAADGGVFPDVEAGKYYSQAVSWCVENGIVTGYQAGQNAGLFLPKADVTREELAVMVWRFERWAGAAVDGAPAAAFAALEDGGLVSGWAREACVWCAAAGVMTGKETAEGTLRLDPWQGATRAQAAKMFARAALIADGEQPYAAQVASQADEAASQGDAVQQAAFDEVTFEDVAFVEPAEDGAASDGGQAPEAGEAAGSGDSVVADGTVESADQVTVADAEGTELLKDAA